MGATIRWNSIVLGNVTDQFLRYSFPIPRSDAETNNKSNATLTITFDPTIDTNGRFMACAGGWDWAPYTLACDKQGRRTFSRGIVAPLYLVAVDRVMVTHVVPKVVTHDSSRRQQQQQTIMGDTTTNDPTAVDFKV